MIYFVLKGKCFLNEQSNLKCDTLFWFLFLKPCYSVFLVCKRYFHEGYLEKEVNERPTRGQLVDQRNDIDSWYLPTDIDLN